MKLFVWNNPYSVPYGSSLVFAIAEDLEAAKKEARNGDAYSYGEFPNSVPRHQDLGEPTRVVDLPCAEWHEWRE